MVSDSGDEKKLEKAEKEAEKRIAKRKCEMSKRPRKSETSSPEQKKLYTWPVDPQQHSNRRPQFTTAPRAQMIGPCGEMGHWWPHVNKPDLLGIFLKEVYMEGGALMSAWVSEKEKWRRTYLITVCTKKGEGVDC